jgi:hypothetical protein
MFFNTINENVPISEMAFFKLLYKKIAEIALFYEKMSFQHFFYFFYEKNCQNDVFSYYFMKNAILAFFPIPL